MSRIAITILGCLSLTCPAILAAPPASAPAIPTVSPADRAADDARQNLFEAVLAAPVVADGGAQSVAGLLAYSPEAERELRKAAYAEARIHRPRETKPGVLAVDASLTADEFNALLAAAVEHGSGARPRQVGLASTAGPALFATGVAVEDGKTRSDQPGWRQCDLSDLIVARNAAEQDLRLRVLACVLRAPVSDRQVVGNLARQQPEIDKSLRKQVEAILGTEPVFAPDGICVVACTVSAGQLRSMIGRAIQEAGFSAGDLKPQFPSESLAFEGLAVAPPRQPAAASSVRGPRPEWADRIISKTAAAAGPPDEPDVAARNRLATQAARIEAQRQLWMELEELKLPSGRTIADAFAAREDRQTAIEAINGAIFEMSKPSVNDRGVVTITLGLRLETAWNVAGR